MIEWIEYNKTNLLKTYADYIKQIEESPNKELQIVTNVLCAVAYKEPKPVGVDRRKPINIIKTNGKVMTSTLIIKYCSHMTTNGKVSGIEFIFGNVSNIIKFCPMESLNILL